MRHAKPWQKNQSRDDTLEILFQKPNKNRIHRLNNLPSLQLFRSSSSRKFFNLLLETPPSNSIRIHFLLHLFFRLLQFPILIHNRTKQLFYLLFISKFVFIDFSLFVMQQLSNDTGSWSLIDAPLPSPLFYNANTYETLNNPSGSNTDYQSQLLPISLDSLTSVTPASITLETHSVNYWAFALIFFPLFTIFGNVLVVVSVYREKSLHTVTNYFVVSLAISDITVAAVVMPFAIYLEVKKSSVSHPSRKKIDSF